MMNSDALAQFVTPLVLSILALCATIARLLARKLGKIPLGVDDYLIVASLVALAILLDWAAFNAGVGQPELMYIPYIYSRYWKQYYLNFVLPIVVVGLVKISVICFYKRIFSGPRFKIVSNVLLTVSVLWIVYHIIMALILKIPLSGVWDINDTHPFTYSAQSGSIQSAVTDILLDLTILAVPIPLIRSLKTTKRRKLMFGLMFGLGAFCVVATIVRLVIVVNFTVHPDPSMVIKETDEVSLWAEIECYVSIIAACLPTFGPLLSRSGALRLVFGRLLDLLVSPFLTRIALTTIIRLPSTDHLPEAMVEAGNAPGRPLPLLQEQQLSQYQPRQAWRPSLPARHGRDVSPDSRRWAHMWHLINPDTVSTMIRTSTMNTGRELHSDSRETEEDCSGLQDNVAQDIEHGQANSSSDDRSEKAVSTHIRNSSDSVS